jgi:hypothetical protein
MKDIILMEKNMDHIGNIFQMEVYKKKQITMMEK